MNRWPIVLFAALLSVAGCAAEVPVRPAGLEQKIEGARTHADHAEIAAIYEQEAERFAADQWNERLFALMYGPLPGAGTGVRTG